MLRCSGNTWNDDPHGPLAFRTGEGVDFVDFLNKTGPVFFGTPSDLRQVPAYMESMHRGPAFGVFRDKRCYNTRSNEPSVDHNWEHGNTWPPTIQGRHTGHHQQLHALPEPQELPVLQELPQEPPDVRLEEIWNPAPIDVLR